jgi:hypothetical protein
MIPDRLVDFSTDRRIKRQATKAKTMHSRQTMSSGTIILCSKVFTPLPLWAGELIRHAPSSQIFMYPSVLIPTLFKLNAVV